MHNHADIVVWFIVCGAIVVAAAVSFMAISARDQAERVDLEARRALLSAQRQDAWDEYFNRKR
jgi:hypothetical protein